MIGVIASHIDCVERLDAFRNLLSTIHGQSKPLDALYIAASCDKPHLEDLIILFSFYCTRIPNLTISLDKTDDKFSQFENYKRLVPLLRDHIDDWVIFSDDDDEWNHFRVETYERESKECGENKNYTHLVSLICKNDGDIQTTKHGLNYTDYAVRCNVLIDFLTTASPATLHHVYADVKFRQFLESRPNKLGAYFIPKNWMYHWRKNGYSVTSRPKREVVDKQLSLKCADYVMKNGDPFFKFYFSIMWDDLLNNIEYAFAHASNMTEVLKVYEPHYLIEESEALKQLYLPYVKDLLENVIKPHWVQTKLFI